mmetsp:Transcript_7633/g.15572  ORF Transcript_7633/g.15572 Transcript_7633/m.15572 type:complete len:1861 (+) Transcript_7633:51-5633(+)
MWSQFAVRQDVVAGAEEPVSAAQQPPLEEEEQINISEDNNGWNDDSFDMEDEEFDTIIDGEGEGSSTLAAAVDTDTNDNAANISTSADGWDDSLLDELNSPPRASSAVQQEENIEDNDDDAASNLQPDTTIDATTAGGGTLVKAAENFGAALLASLDDDDEEDDQQQQQTSGRGGGFGAGFVMKGLSRFIEAATIPQEEYEEEEDMNDDEDGGGGWDDDDNLEMDDDDDFDFSQNDDGDHLEETRVDDDVMNESIPDGDLEKSDSIPIVQNLVEEEEEEILAQEDGWDDIDVDDSMFEQEVEESNGERLDSGDNHSNQMIVDNYEIDKDKSPEPVVKHDDAEERSSSLPHQQSWYINAMEGGQGGVVYSEKLTATNNDASIPLEHVQELIDSTTESESVLQAEVTSNVGMPISEMPSANTSPRSNSEENIAPITQCELKCECLELIMPLPDNNGGSTTNGSPPENDGFGTKTLPDGTTVLVNYEQLLLNEATKRILLERTVESYERTMANLESTHQTTLLQSNMEHEEKENVMNSQLLFANNEIAELKTLNSRLQLEKEQLQSESHLFEAERTAVCNERDQLQNQLVSLEEKLKSKEDEAQSLKSSLAEVQNETTELKSEIEMLERECDELHEEMSGKKKEVFQLHRQSSENFADNTTKAFEVARLQEQNVSLKGKVESLQKELDTTAEGNKQLKEENKQLNHQVSASFANHATKAVEYEQTCGRLENELSEAKVQLTTFRDENEELRNIQRESDAQIIELRSTIESMDGDAGEATHLVAEIANLKYELETKVVECQESAAEKNRMEHELTEAKTELATLREQNDELRVTVESMDGDSGEVNQLAAEIANLKYEVEAKVAECRESTAEKNQLEAILTGVKAELTTLRDANESVRNTQRESDAQINELRATIESMDGDTGEVNQLVAEVANLKYALEEKVVECGESTALKAELTTLRDENESLRLMQRDADAQINELRATVESMDGATEEVNELVAEVAQLKYEIEATVAECGESIAEKNQLEIQLSETNAELATLREGNESLRLMQRDSDAQINELRATIESMNGDTSEVDKLVAEVAILKYELEAKVAERNDNINALQALQAKLDNAEECLNETMNVSGGDAEDALKAENYELSSKLVDLQSNLNAVESSRLDLQLVLEEKSRTIESFETQMKSLNAQLLEASQLQQEMIVLRKALEDKSQECEIFSSKADELQAALDYAQADHVKAIKESSDQSNEQMSKLQAQIADLLRDQNVTMQGMEDRLVDASNQITNLSAQCDDCRQKLEYSQTECARFTDTISKLEDEKVQLSSALESVNSALEENQKEASINNTSVDIIKEEMKSIMSQNKELIERNQVILQEKAGAVEALDIKTSEFEEEVSRCNTSVDMIKEEIESIKNQNKELIERNQALLHEKDGTFKALVAKTTELEREKKLFETSHKANSEAQQSILDLERQLQDLKITNKRLESELFETSFAADDNEALMKERDDLAQEAQALREQVNELSSQVADAFRSVEREALLARISNLEAELHANENAGDLRDELTSIQEEREQLDLDNEELLVQLGLMQQDKLEHEAARQVEIDGLREQVSSLKDKCDCLQNDLRSASTSQTEDNRNEVIERLQGEIRQLKENSATLSKDKLENEAARQVEIDGLREQVSNLKDTCDRLQNDLRSASSSQTEENRNEVIERLQGEIRQLKATLSKDISLLKLKLADKDSEVTSIKEQMENALNEKDEELCKLRAAEQLSYTEETNEEIEGEPFHQDQSYVKTEEEKECYSGDEDDDSLQGLLAEETDSDDFLRSQIVILAQALERAELRRAQALERIVTERKSNADIVSQLGLSVKRFYSTIRRSDGP